MHHVAQQTVEQLEVGLLAVSSTFITSGITCVISTVSFSLQLGDGFDTVTPDPTLISRSQCDPQVCF
jgi:hypothetical protein